MRKLQYEKEDWIKAIDGTRSAKQVAELMGVYRSTVYYNAKKYNLPLQRDILGTYKGISEHSLRQDLQNMTLGDVAKKYNIVNTTLFREWCLSRNIKFTTTIKTKSTPNEDIKPRKRTGESLEMIKYLLNEFTDASIARVFGYSKERIRQIRNELGISIYKE